VPQEDEPEGVHDGQAREETEQLVEGQTPRGLRVQAKAQPIPPSAGKTA
jgi:hypothetical protein